MRQVAVIIVLAAVVSACSHQAGPRSGSPNAAGQACVDSGLGARLPLPDVPDVLTGAAERGDYIVEHFWDGLDFRDTLRSRDRRFMEPNFVGFISMLSGCSEKAQRAGVGELLSHAAVDSAALALVSDLAEHYLNEPNSPFRNEERYICFLEEYLSLPAVGEEARLRPAAQLAVAKKNRIGAIASDFRYVDRDGSRHTLHSMPGIRLLLIFYDPDCPHCSDILRQLHESRVLGQMISKHELEVLAIYTEGDAALWNMTKAMMPSEWHVGMDADGILAKGIYSLPAMPVIYLLDGRKRVLLKDTDQATLEACLLGQCGVKP